MKTTVIQNVTKRMEKRGTFWTNEDENRMISILAQTKMSSVDCDIVFANMFGRTPTAIHMRRVQIAHRLLHQGHTISYVSQLMHLDENECFACMK